MGAEWLANISSRARQVVGLLPDTTLHHALHHETAPGVEKLAYTMAELPHERYREEECCSCMFGTRPSAPACLEQGLLLPRVHRQLCLVESDIHKPPCWLHHGTDAG